MHVPLCPQQEVHLLQSPKHPRVTEHVDEEKRPIKRKKNECTNHGPFLLVKTCKHTQAAQNENYVVRIVFLYLPLHADATESV